MDWFYCRFWCIIISTVDYWPNVGSETLERDINSAATLDVKYYIWVSTDTQGESEDTRMHCDHTNLHDLVIRCMQNVSSMVHGILLYALLYLRLQKNHFAIWFVKQHSGKWVWTEKTNSTILCNTGVRSPTYNILCSNTALACFSLPSTLFPVFTPLSLASPCITSVLFFLRLF